MLLLSYLQYLQPSCFSLNSTWIEVSREHANLEALYRKITRGYSSKWLITDGKITQGIWENNSWSTILSSMCHHYLAIGNPVNLYRPIPLHPSPLPTPLDPRRYNSWGIISSEALSKKPLPFLGMYWVIKKRIQGLLYLSSDQTTDRTWFPVSLKWFNK